MVNEEEELILALLSGRMTYDNGLPEIQYLEGDEERKARTVLAARLRTGPISGEIRDQIAALIDPQHDTHPAIERKIEFIHRRAGQQSTPPTLKTAIAQYLNSRVKAGEGISAAVRAAVNEFGLSERYIWAIWKLYRRRADLL
jgi:hypothetical protein